MTPLKFPNIVDFLGEYLALFETALVRESWPWWGWLMKKTEGRKSRATVSLSGISEFMFNF
jgi:hypothetical protein